MSLLRLRRRNHVHTLGGDYFPIKAGENSWAKQMLWDVLKKLLTWRETISIHPFTTVTRRPGGRR